MKQAKFPPFGSGAVGEKRQHQKIGRRKKRPRKEARLCARWRFIPFAKWRGEDERLHTETINAGGGNFYK
jgi:hypothetical protein